MKLNKEEKEKVVEWFLYELKRSCKLEKNIAPEQVISTFILPFSIDKVNKDRKNDYYRGMSFRLWEYISSKS